MSYATVYHILTELEMKRKRARSMPQLLSDHNKGKRVTKVGGEYFERMTLTSFIIN